MLIVEFHTKTINFQSVFVVVKVFNLPQLTSIHDKIQAWISINVGTLKYMTHLLSICASNQSSHWDISFYELDLFSWNNKQTLEHWQDVKI